MADVRVAATILTRNRVGLLRESVRAAQAQTRPVDELIVVDNASEDGTLEVLASEFPDVAVVALPENQGATGGFYEAIAAGRRTGADWLWLLDDDSIARPDALEELVAVLDRLDGELRPTVLCSRVEWSDGTPHVMNRPVIRPDSGQQLVEAVSRRLYPIRAASWVSVMISSEAVDRYGMPLRQFFYQADDIEYTARILRDSPGYYVPRSVVLHDTPTQHTAVDDDHRFHFHIRNTILMLRGGAWELREKPGLVWVLIWTSLIYLRINRRRPLPALRNLVGGLVSGVRTPAG
ncbi:MAG TPA: glycosyltransferase [Thermoleophilaceae bacterium]|nr:glycosyltransferase [Thermoleophilaceae bacterium]